MEGDNGNASQSGPAVAIPKMKRPDKPDNKELRKQVEKLSAEITRYANRMKEIKETLATQRRPESGAGSQEHALTRRLAELKAEAQRNLKQKQSIREEMNRVNESLESMRSQVKEIKEKFKVDEIDAQIKKLEDKINHTTMSESEENEAINQVRKFAISRETMIGHTRQLDMQLDGKTREELISKLKAVDQEADRIKKEENQIRHQLANVRAEQAMNSEDVEALIQEKQDCWEVMTALKDKKKEIEEDFGAKMDAFRKEEAIYREKRQEVYRKRDEDKAADLERTKAEREAKRVEHAAAQQDIKKEENLLVCDQLLSYLKKYTQEKAEESQAVKDEQYQVPAEGMRLVKKDVPDEDEGSGWMFRGKASAKKSGKGRKQKNVGEKACAEKKLNFTLDIMSAFHSLKVPVPNNVSEVPSAIEAIQKTREKIEAGEMPLQSSSRSKKEGKAKHAASEGKADGQLAADGETVGKSQEGGNVESCSAIDEGASENANNGNVSRPEESKHDGGKEDFPPLGGVGSEGLGVGA